jgi:hypothetical protein
MALVSGYSGPRRSWTQRVLAAAKLDATVYEEVEADQTATMQAAGVVALCAVAKAIGASDDDSAGVILEPIGAIVGWWIWAGITYLIGKSVFKGTATWGELLRTIGFANAIGMLYVLGVIPGIGGLFTLVVSVWMLVAGVIAIRQALDISTGKAIVVAVIGWAVIVIPFLVLGGAFLMFRN